MSDSIIKRIIITGNKQSGKSTFAAELADTLKNKNIKIAGIISQGIWKNNRREGFDLIDLKTNKIYPLAKRINNSDQHGITCFKFLKTGLNAGYLALMPEQCYNAKVIFIDEIGRLEMKNYGWSRFLSPLLAIKSALHIWVVRKKFVEEICSIWKVGNTEIVNIDDKNSLSRMVKICMKQDLS